MAVPSTCHWLKDFWLGSSSLILQLWDEGGRSGIPWRKVISTSSCQPAWCWILCPINDTFLICEHSRAAPSLAAPAQQPSWMQPELSHWQWLGHNLFLFLKHLPHAEILLFKLLWVYVNTNFCFLTLWRSWLWHREPIPLLEHFFFPFCILTWCGGLSTPCLAHSAWWCCEFKPKKYHNSKTCLAAHCESCRVTTCPVLFKGDLGLKLYKLSLVSWV